MEFKATLQAQEWDYILMCVAERPIKEGMGVFTKLTSQLQGQKAESIAPPPVTPTPETPANG